MPASLHPREERWKETQESQPLGGWGARSRRKKTFLQFLECKFLSHPIPCSYCPPCTLLFFFIVASKASSLFPARGL